MSKSRITRLDPAAFGAWDIPVVIIDWEGPSPGGGKRAGRWKFDTDADAETSPAGWRALESFQVARASGHFVDELRELWTEEKEGGPIR